MRKHFLKSLLTGCVLLHAPYVTAEELTFGVIAQPMKDTVGEAVLRDTIAETDMDNLAFVVIEGIKAASDPCSDTFYNNRKALLNSAKNGLIVSLSASDWTECRTSHDRSAAIGRLTRLRELFFIDEFSLGATKIPLLRQSTTARFRSYGENARWEIGRTMFATINLPADNNHFRPEAGRNNEFDDRLIANRYWLHRLVVHARSKKMNGIVLFSDGNPFAKHGQEEGIRDGFAEMRKQITTLASRFPGRVLIVHGHSTSDIATPNAIAWRGNLGILEASAPWIKLSVSASQPTLFAVVETTGTKN